LGKIKFQVLSWPIHKPELIYIKGRDLQKSRKSSVRLRSRIHCVLPLQAGTVQEVFHKPGMAIKRPTLVPVLCWISKSSAKGRRVWLTHWRSHPSLPAFLQARDTSQD